MHEYLAHPPADHEIGEDHLGVGVVVPAVVRRELIGPHERAVRWAARQHAVRPFVLARPLLGVVGSGISRAEVDEVELRVVGDPAPHGSAAALPRVATPGRDADVRSTAKGASPGLREHQRIGAHVVRGPENLAGGKIESLHPAVDPELAARRTHDDAVAGDERGHGCRLALPDIADLRLPDLTSRLRIDRDGVTIEQVIDDLAVGVHRAAIDRVAAGDADGGGIHVGAILPPQRIALLREIEGVEDIGERGYNVHRASDNERLPLMPAEHAGREIPDGAQLAGVGWRDLREAAVTGGGVILCRHGPLAVVLRRYPLQDRDNEQRDVGSVH